MFNRQPDHLLILSLYDWFMSCIAIPISGVGLIDSCCMVNEHFDNFGISCTSNWAENSAAILDYIMNICATDTYSTTSVFPVTNSIKDKKLLLAVSAPGVQQYDNGRVSLLT